METPRFFIGLSLGFLVGIGSLMALGNPGNFTASLGGETSSSASSLAPLILSATDVKTDGWWTFRDDKLGIELQYPSATYSMKVDGQTLTIQSEEDPRIHIELEKMRGTLRKNVDASMQQAGLKIRDRQTLALQTPYFSDEADHLTTTYLLIRNFAENSEDGVHTMFKVTVSLPRNHPAFAAARAQGILDPESVMTEPDQILSTFRFLQYDEAKPSLKTTDLFDVEQQGKKED